MKSNFKLLQVDKPIVSIIASGTSVDKLSDEFFVKLHEQTYTFFMNYAPIKFPDEVIDCLIFSDKRVTKFLEDYYKQAPTYNLLVREDAFSGEPKLKTYIKYWFNTAVENIKGNFTIVWLLSLLKKYHKDKTILLFGLDSYGNNKWYDKYTSYDKHNHGHINLQGRLSKCDQQLSKIDKTNVFNCNMKSGNEYFTKRHYSEFLKL